MGILRTVTPLGVSALNTTEKSSRGSSYPDYKFAFSVGCSFLTIIVNEWSWQLRTPMQASKTRENKSIDDESDDDEKFYLYPDTWYKISAVFKDRNEGKCFHVKEESVHTVLIGSSHQGDLSC